ncbi:hypothetical protein [Psychromonas ossibalaenae]|uniref:hypothetical protein n=1 Tax=Psychromonas ossibalaenae TaxID=444922 RepID=UPI00037B9482|nr:hypothetical protein [Psychromonas ossibalaenae]
MKHKLLGLLLVSCTFTVQAENLSRSELERCINLKQEVNESQDTVNSLKAGLKKLEGDFKLLLSSIPEAEAQAREAALSCRTVIEDCERANMLVAQYKELFMEQEKLLAEHEAAIAPYEKEKLGLKEIKRNFKRLCHKKAFYYDDLEALCANVFDWNWIMCLGRKKAQ